MNLFFEYPSRNFQIREVSRLSKIAVTSVKKYLDELRKEGFVIKDKNTLYPSYISNQQNRMFKIYKQQYFILKLHSSGFIDYLEDELHPKCIVLFGSMGKGEYNYGSDIDIFIQAPEKKLNLLQYEKKLNREINLLFEENFSRLSKELKNNVINGIILKGYLKVF